MLVAGQLKPPRAATYRQSVLLYEVDALAVEHERVDDAMVEQRRRAVAQQREQLRVAIVLRRLLAQDLVLWGITYRQVHKGVTLRHLQRQQ